MDELADLDEITYVRLLVFSLEFQGCRWKKTLETNYEGKPRRKRKKIDEAQYALIFKNNLSTGGAIEQYYLPILETET